MKTISTVLIAIALSVSVYGQEQSLKIVFDITSKNTKIQEATVKHLTIMARDYPNSQFEAVIYSGALDMLLPEKSTVAKQIEELTSKKNVTIVACEMTMKRYNVTNKDMLKGVGSVHNGITEIALKQQAGWSYIKEAD